MLRFSFIPAVKGGVFQVFFYSSLFCFHVTIISVYRIAFHTTAKPTNRKALKKGLSARFWACQVVHYVVLKIKYYNSCKITMWKSWL